MGHGYAPLEPNLPNLFTVSDPWPQVVTACCISPPLTPFSSSADSLPVYPTRSCAPSTLRKAHILPVAPCPSLLVHDQFPWSPCATTAVLRAPALTLRCFPTHLLTRASGLGPLRRN
eukprot:15432462-Alexandrium_andersonii.AAC.2